MTDYRWQLPDGVDELLPPMARQMEHLRREVLDVFHRWGFDLIDPPVIEYLDALLVGSGSDLDLQTLKTVDQRSGRQLGVRADMTSQAVRIDAQRTREQTANSDVARLCYSGVVVHANPQGVHESRVPIKAGAEIFGAPELAADAEIVALMLDVLAHGGIDAPVLVLGHMGIYNALVSQADLNEPQRVALFNAVQIKSEADIATLLPAGALRDQLVALPNLMGSGAVLEDARHELRDAPDAALAALDALADLSERVLSRVPGAVLRFDLAELAGFGYHTGPIYSAYHSQLGRALARGGRYDGLGAAFGQGRSATGFDVSLRPLLATQQSFKPARSIWVSHQSIAGADASASAVLWQQVATMRDQGHRVLVALSVLDSAPDECNKECVWREGAWQIVDRSN